MIFSGKERRLLAKSASTSETTVMKNLRPLASVLTLSVASMVLTACSALGDWLPPNATVQPPENWFAPLPGEAAFAH
jgi:hypothetical protein